MSSSGKFGTILKELRRLRKITQDELAESTGRSIDAVSQWERGVNLPTYETLVRLCEALDVPMSTFFDQQDRTKTDQRLKLEIEGRVVLEGLSDDDLSVAVDQIRALAKRR